MLRAAKIGRACSSQAPPREPIGDPPLPVDQFSLAFDRPFVSTLVHSKCLLAGNGTPYTRSFLSYKPRHFEFFLAQQARITLVQGLEQRTGGLHLRHRLPLGGSVDRGLPSSLARHSDGVDSLRLDANRKSP